MRPLIRAECSNLCEESKQKQRPTTRRKTTLATNTTGDEKLDSIGRVQTDRKQRSLMQELSVKHAEHFYVKCNKIKRHMGCRKDLHVIYMLYKYVNH